MQSGVIKNGMIFYGGHVVGRKIIYEIRAAQIRLGNYFLLYLQSMKNHSDRGNNIEQENRHAGFTLCFQEGVLMQPQTFGAKASRHPFPTSHSPT